MILRIKRMHSHFAAFDVALEESAFSGRFLVAKRNFNPGQRPIRLTRKQKKASIFLIPCFFFFSDNNGLRGHRRRRVRGNRARRLPPRPSAIAALCLLLAAARRRCRAVAMCALSSAALLLHRVPSAKSTRRKPRMGQSFVCVTRRFVIASPSVKPRSDVTPV